MSWDSTLPPPPSNKAKCKERGPAPAGSLRVWDHHGADPSVGRNQVAHDVGPVRPARNPVVEAVIRSNDVWAPVTERMRLGSQREPHPRHGAQASSR